MKKFLAAVLISAGPLMAQPCENIFATQDLLIGKLARSRVMTTPEVESLFFKMRTSEKVLLLDALDVFGGQRFSRAIDLLEKRPEVFKGLDAFDEMRFLSEVVSPGHAERSFARKFQQTNDYIWKMPEFVPGASATKLDLKYRKAFIQVREFLDNEKRVFQRMQEFESEITLKTRLAHRDFDNYSPREQALAKQESMERILDDYEQLHGFKSSINGEYKALELDDKSYTMEEWFEMLREGKQFNDTAFKQAGSAAEIDEDLRKAHGYFTHRIQWHILMKEMDANPARFESFRGVELFKKLGDEDFGIKLGMNNSPANTLWQHLFDALGSGTYHSPEFFRTTHTLYPEIGAWL